RNSFYEAQSVNKYRATPDSNVPVNVNSSGLSGEKMIDISADYSGSYDVTESGRLFVWGSNYADLLGLYKNYKSWDG
ncbi:MAG: hypothetical protein N6V49_12735, partial [Serratia symbiotica]|nr:hypothetical protein [Serratia symbiotica]